MDSERVVPKRWRRAPVSLEEGLEMGCGILALFEREDRIEEVF